MRQLSISSYLPGRKPQHPPLLSCGMCLVGVDVHLSGAFVARHCAITAQLYKHCILHLVHHGAPLCFIRGQWLKRRLVGEVCVFVCVCVCVCEHALIWPNCIFFFTDASFKFKC